MATTVSGRRARITSSRKVERRIWAFLQAAFDEATYPDLLGGTWDDVNDWTAAEEDLVKAAWEAVTRKLAAHQGLKGAAL